MSSLHHFFTLFFTQKFSQGTSNDHKQSSFDKEGQRPETSDTNDFRGVGCSGGLTPGGQTLSNLLIHSETW